MKVIETDKAPKAIGTYSQAVVVNGFAYTAGQIALDPESLELVSTDFKEQAYQAFKNLKVVIEASEGKLSQVVKLNVSVTDLGNFSVLNQVMSEFFSEPYPARAAVEVKALPKNALVELEAIVAL